MTGSMAVYESKKPKVERYVFYAPYDFIEKVDEVGRKMGVTNRSELIRMALRDLIEKWGSSS